jgi:putative peptidoglycan lipid II flippase
MLGVGVYEINILLTRLFASYLPSGSQSYLYYGQRLAEIPQGMFALAIASATLPSLADLRNRGEHDTAKKTFVYSFRLSLFVAIPASMALAVLAQPIVTVLFGRGAFGSFQIMETARSLVWMAAGVWAVASVRSVIQMYFAYNDTRTPVLCSALNVAVFAGLSLSLMGPMRHMGIAAATSAGALVQLSALLILLRRRIGRFALGEVLAGALRCVVAAGAMAGAVHGVALLGRWERGGNDPLNIAVLVGAVVSGIAVYLIGARLLRCPELEELRSAMAGKRKRSAS